MFGNIIWVPILGAAVQRVFCKEIALENFAKFTGKWESLFKNAGLRARTK